MSAKCTFFSVLLAMLICLVAMLGVPANAHADGHTYLDKVMHAETIDDLVKAEEGRIVSLEKRAAELKEHKKALDAIGRSGFADYGGMEDALDEYYEDKGWMDKALKAAKKRLEMLKNLDKPEYADLKKLVLDDIATRKEFFRLIDLCKHGRETGTMLPSDYETNIRTIRQLGDKLDDNRKALAAGIKKVDDAKKAALGGGSSGGGGNQCFVAGTLVLMADGSFKPIERIVVGDRVLSRDVQSGEEISGEVYRLMRGTEDHVFRFADGLQVNGDHRFYTALGTCPAAKLTPGTVLVGLDGPRTLASIQREGPTLASTDEGALPGIPVYNIMVRGVHNYFVSPDGDNTYLVLDISACGE